MRATFLRGFPLPKGTRRFLMPRYKLTIEYDGAPFAGWQVQAPMTHGTGRAGEGSRADQWRHPPLSRVRAAPMPASMRWRRWRMWISRKTWDPFVLRNALNAHVRPHPVSVLEAEQVPEDFHARFSATRRHYLYRILNRRSPPALDQGQGMVAADGARSDAMHEAAQALIGKHDFTTFRAASARRNRRSRPSTGSMWRATAR